MDLANAKPKLIHRLTFEGAWPTAVAFLGTGHRLAAGNRNGEIYIWQLPSENSTTENATTEEEAGKNNSDSKDDQHSGPPPIRLLEGNTNGITHLVTTDGGKTLIASSLDHSVRLWNLDSATAGTREVVLDIQQREAEAKRTRKDDALDAPGVAVETLKEQFQFPGHSDWVNALGVSGDGRRLISGDDDGRVIVWDLAARTPVSQWQGDHDNWICSACLSPDGTKAFVAEFCSKRGDFDHPPAQAKLYSADDGKEMLDLMAIQFPDTKRDNSYGYRTKWGKFVGRGFVTAAFSPDGKLLALGQGGEIGQAKVHLIDAETGKVVRTVSDHKYGVCHVAFSQDGKYVLSSGRDTTIRVCRVDDGKEVQQISKPRGGQFKDWIYAFDLSPDESRLAAADIAGHIQVWQL